MNTVAVPREPDADAFILLLLCLVLLAASVVGLPFALAASRNEGTPGTFTAVERDCDRYACSWTGVFVSDDGRIRDEHADFSSENIERAGDKVRAQKGVAGDESVYAPNSRFWLFWLFADVGCLAYVVWYFRAWRRSRPGEPETTGPDPDTSAVDDAADRDRS
ncbi:hypothetical protein [Nocardioides sp. WS12]|uniref:hypothetical protein n=1 Tax=Nocardioides sp. WS12 TaxID=2486272 RepID=UPI0015FA68B7|nr:hypothetical protein [Nocardioides sp. WS12]